MAFIDGENLVGRFQAMLTQGRLPHPGVAHRENEYVWMAATPIPGWLEVVRAYYYTSVVGEQDHIDLTVDTLRRLPFTNGGLSAMQCLLLARVFKRAKNTKKTSTVDINLTVDMLNHAAQRSAETFYLLSGDGDFVPLVEAVAARGCRVIVAAFSSGVSMRLARSADRFIDLDDTYFLPTI